MIVPLPDDPHLKAKEQLLRDMAEARTARAEEAYHQAIEDQYYIVSQFRTGPLPDDAYQVRFRPHDATDWQALGYTTGPIVGIDFGGPDPAESAVVVWPRQYGKTAALGTVTVEAPFTGDTRTLFDALLAGHRAQMDRRLQRLADDLGLWESHVRYDFHRVQQVLEEAGVGDGYGRLTVPQPVRPPVQAPRIRW